MIKAIISLAFIFSLSSCASYHAARAKDYSTQAPKLQIQQYFKGNVTADGLAFNQNKQMTRRYRSKIEGIWKNGDGFFNEKISYADGQNYSREWCFHFLDNNHFVGISTDATGTIRGEQYGNVIHIIYHPSVAIDLAYHLHTQNEALTRYRTSPLENIYSLLSAGSWYSKLKSISTLERQNIKPIMNAHSGDGYSMSDIGPFCQKNKK